METENEIRAGLPSKQKDGIYNRPLRLNQYAEQIAQLFGPDRAAEEGTRYVATNPTMGTAIATTTSITAFTVASPIMVLQNNNGQDGANITLDYLRLLMAQVPTSATQWHWAMVKDTVNRYTSGGSIIVPTNVNSGAPINGSGLKIAFGAIVAPVAGAAARFTHRSLGRSAIPVINDEWLFKFASPTHDGAGSLGGAVALRMPVPAGPEVLRPGDNWVLYGWGAANAAAPSWEFELGYTER